MPLWYSADAAGKTRRRQRYDLVQMQPVQEMPERCQTASDVRMVLEGAVLHKEGGVMMATARYQIVHFDHSPVWRKTVILETHKRYPDNIAAGKWFLNRRASSEWAQCQMDELARREVAA